MGHSYKSWRLSILICDSHINDPLEGHICVSKVITEVSTRVVGGGVRGRVIRFTNCVQDKFGSSYSRQGHMIQVGKPMLLGISVNKFNSKVKMVIDGY